MTAALIWLVLGLGLVAAELLSGDFVLLMLGGGALAAAGVSMLVGGGLLIGVGSVLLLLAARPMLRRRLERSVDSSPMHHKALIGRTAVVVRRVDEHGGQVKVGGDLWSARAIAGPTAIEPGAAVRILDITGATALVVPDG